MKNQFFRPAKAGDTITTMKEWFYDHSPEMPIEVLTRYYTIIDHGINWLQLEQLALLAAENNPPARKVIDYSKEVPANQDIMYSCI